MDYVAKGKGISNKDLKCLSMKFWRQRGVLGTKLEKSCAEFVGELTIRKGKRIFNTRLMISTMSSHLRKKIALVLNQILTVFNA